MLRENNNVTFPCGYGLSRRGFRSFFRVDAPEVGTGPIAATGVTTLIVGTVPSPSTAVVLTIDARAASIVAPETGTDPLTRTGRGGLVGTTAAKVAGIVGRDGGHTRKAADACILVPTVNAQHVTPHTEAFQAVLWHLLVTHPALKAAETKWESVR